MVKVTVITCIVETEILRSWSPFQKTKTTRTHFYHSKFVQQGPFTKFDFCFFCFFHPEYHPIRLSMISGTSFLIWGYVIVAIIKASYRYVPSLLNTHREGWFKLSCPSTFTLTNDWTSQRGFAMGTKMKYRIIPIKGPGRLWNWKTTLTILPPNQRPPSPAFVSVRNYFKQKRQGASFPLCI